tara:strand:+ start:10805 stop:10942 length:138 start_codon:yes stop_codon:yes gene_type:complete
MNIDAIRAEILNPERYRMVENGCTKIMCDGVCFIVKNKTVVTTVD